MARRCLGDNVDNMARPLGDFDAHDWNEGYKVLWIAGRDLTENLDDSSLPDGIPGGGTSL